MNIACIYATKTKHSKKLAEAIGQTLDIIPLDVHGNPPLNDIDLLFVVGGIYRNQSLPAMLEYLHGLEFHGVKKAALVTSCVSREAPQGQVREILRQKGVAVFEEEFICQGSLLFFGMGHPNNRDLTAAAAFARKIRRQCKQEDSITTLHD